MSTDNSIAALPDTIDLSDNEQYYFDSLFEDLTVLLKRKNELDQTTQQLNNAIQQNSAELMGIGKAIQKLIDITLKQKGITGVYKWDLEKRALVRQNDKQEIMPRSTG